MNWRLDEAPDLKALTGRVIGTGKDQSVIVWIVSAGELLDEVAHRQIWRKGSAAESCALYGDKRSE